MISLLQRVHSAAVSVDGKEISSIENGILLFVGLEKGDEPADISYTVKKVAELRIFEDEQGRMNRSIIDAGGDILAVSQFTLAGKIHKGRRPGFDNAMPPAVARQEFENFVALLSDVIPRVKTGSFGEHMNVSLVNDGPVTFVIDSKKRL